MTNRQMAEAMFLAEKTVKNYVSSMLAKLGSRAGPRRRSSPSSTRRNDRRSRWSREGEALMPERDPTVRGADFDELLREVLARVKGAIDEQARLRLLLDAVVTMAADLTLDGVLARIVEIARQLTGAQYAALGVLNSGPKSGLRTFVHHGMSPVQVEEIGELPTGSRAPRTADRPSRTASVARDRGAPRVVRLPCLTTLRCAPSSAYRSGSATRSSATCT